MLAKIGRPLHRVAEWVAAGLMAVIFVSFLIQIVFRYAFNFPVGWTSELSVVCWLWLVLWGAGFMLKEHEEIRIKAVREQFAMMGDLGKLNKQLHQFKEDQTSARKGKIVGQTLTYPGVVIKFPGDSLPVKSEMRYTTFYFERGEIRTLAR